MKNRLFIPVAVAVAVVAPLTTNLFELSGFSLGGLLGRLPDPVVVPPVISSSSTTQEVIVDESVGTGTVFGGTTSISPDGMGNNYIISEDGTIIRYEDGAGNTLPLPDPLPFWAL